MNSSGAIPLLPVGQATLPSVPHPGLSRIAPVAVIHRQAHSSPAQGKQAGSAWRIPSLAERMLTMLAFRIPFLFLDMEA